MMCNNQHLYICVCVLMLTFKPNHGP